MTIRLQGQYSLLMLLLVAVVGSSMLAVALYHFRSSTIELSRAGAGAMEHSLLAQIERRGVTMGTLLADSLFTPVYRLDLEQINALTSAASEQEGVMLILVLDEDKRIIDDGTDVLPDFKIPDPSVVPMDMLDVDMVRVRSLPDALMVSAPIAAGDQRYGTLVIALSKESVNIEIENVREDFALLGNAAQRETIALAALVALVFSALASLLAWALAHKLVRPIQILIDFAREFGRGNYDADLSIRRRDEIGELSSALLDMRDNLRRQRDLEQRALRLEAETRAKSQFLANMSHEIRTPINGVLGLTELLGRTGLDEKQLEYVSSICTSGKALLAIVNDVLDLSKIEAGQLRLQVGAFALQGLIDDIEAMFKDAAAQSGVQLEFQVDPEVDRGFTGDAVRIRQVLTNFVGNALKFTEAGSVRMRIDCVRDTGFSQQLRFEVRDTGIGIAAGEVDGVFDTFTQADSGSDRQYQGTGLALAICRQLVDLMDGDIGVESRLGSGSTFWFVIELDKADPNARADTGSFEPVRCDDMRVLLVEDHPVNQLLASHMLEALSCSVEVAGDGEVALDKLARQTFDIVLMDCNMPVMDGFTATARIREMESGTGRHQHIVALTANAIEGDRERCLSAGMDDYLSKPFSMEQMARKLAAVAGSRAAGSSSEQDRGVNAEAKSQGAETVAGPVAGGADAVLIDSTPLDRIRALRRPGKRDPLAFAVQSFLDSLPRDLETIDDACARGDAEALRAAAHRLKGAARTVGAVLLADIAQRIEAGAGAGDLDAAPAEARAIRDHVPDLRAALLAELEHEAA